MKIALNAQLISDQATYRGAGVSNYSAELLRALGQLALDSPGEALELTAFLHVAGFQAPGVRQVLSSLPLELPVARILWEQSVLPLQLRRWRADLVHGMVNVLPLATRSPAVVTVHDLAFVRAPGTLPPFKRLYLTALCRASVRRAAQVIAVSQQTAADLQHFFALPAERVTVVYNGVAERFGLRSAAQQQAFRQRSGLPERYLLYVGTLEPRKNLELLLHAFARWRQHCRPAERSVKLVLAGAKGWYYTTIFQQMAALGLEECVLLPGFVPAAELPDWYAAAEVFVYPSLFEGFGLPVLEAMASGTPVICSQAPGVGEVAGEAAFLFPPQICEALVAALEGVVGQPGVQQHLRQRGLEQAQRFSWRRSAAATIQVYRRTLANL